MSSILYDLYSSEAQVGGTAVSDNKIKAALKNLTLDDFNTAAGARSTAHDILARALGITAGKLDGNGMTTWNDGDITTVTAGLQSSEINQRHTAGLFALSKTNRLFSTMSLDQLDKLNDEQDLRLKIYVKNLRNVVANPNVYNPASMFGMTASPFVFTGGNGIKGGSYMRVNVGSRHDNMAQFYEKLYNAYKNTINRTLGDSKNLSANFTNEVEKVIASFKNNETKLRGYLKTMQDVAPHVGVFNSSKHIGDVGSDNIAKLLQNIKNSTSKMKSLGNGLTSIFRAIGLNARTLIGKAEDEAFEDVVKTDNVSNDIASKVPGYYIDGTTTRAQSILPPGLQNQATIATSQAAQQLMRAASNKFDVLQAKAAASARTFVVGTQNYGNGVTPLGYFGTKQDFMEALEDNTHAKHIEANAIASM